MFHLIGAEAAASENSAQEITLSADDPESLLVSWLEELLLQHELNNLVPASIRLVFNQANRIQADIQWSASENATSHIKAVTFHNLEIIENQGRLQAEIVFDV
jgi:SHS2 domain-containing protein